jgi:hypothetical protein
LPVPLSPVISTVVGVDAICTMSCSTQPPPAAIQDDLRPQNQTELA